MERKETELLGYQAPWDQRQRQNHAHTVWFSNTFIFGNRLHFVPADGHNGKLDAMRCLSLRLFFHHSTKFQRTKALSCLVNLAAEVAEVGGEGGGAAARRGGRARGYGRKSSPKSAPEVITSRPRPLAFVAAVPAVPPSA